MKQLTKEIWLPKIAGLGVFLFILFINYVFESSIIISEALVSASITVASIFAGFETINRNTVLTLKSKALERIRSSSYYDVLLKYISEALHSSLIFIVFCLLLIAVPSSLREGQVFFVAVWGGLVAWMLLCFIRIHRVMEIFYSQAKGHDTRTQN